MKLEDHYDIKIELEIGQRALVFRNKCFARNLQHGIDNPYIGDIAGANLTIDHFQARGRKSGHGWTPEESGHCRGTG